MTGQAQTVTQNVNSESFREISLTIFRIQIPHRIIHRIPTFGPDIEVTLYNKSPETLRQTFSEVLRVDKKLRDQEALRSKNASALPNEPYQSRRSHIKITFYTLTNFVPRRLANIQFNNHHETKISYCCHCKINGHTDALCFILHPELKKNYPTTTHGTDSSEGGNDPMHHPSWTVHTIPRCLNRFRNYSYY